MNWKLKSLFLVLMCISTLFLNAQQTKYSDITTIEYAADSTVIFDPATHTETLPAGMEIVTIDGIKYLQVVVDGWNSVLEIPEFTVNLGTHFAANIRSQVSSTVDMQTVINVIDTAGGNNSQQLLQYPVANDFKPVNIQTGSITEVHALQFYCQERSGWNATIGDTIWVGKVYITEQSADMLFDPALFSGSLPSGMELVTVNDIPFLKVNVDGWDSQLDLGYTFNTGNSNKVAFEMLYEEGFSGLSSNKVRWGFNLSEGGSNGQIIEGFITDATVISYQKALSRKSLINQIQFFVLDTSNWNSISGASLFIGKMTCFEVADEIATPPMIADINYTDMPIFINGLYDNAFDESKEFFINRIALGTVNGISAGADIEVDKNEDSYGVWLSVWDNNYLYLYLEVTDDDPIDLGSSASPWYNDGIEIYIDAHDRRFVGGDRIANEQHQIRINLDSNVAGKKGVLSSTANFLLEDNDTTNVKFAIAPGIYGYTMEVAIPWATFYKTSTNTRAEALALARDTNNLVDGHKVAFEISLLDANAVDTRKSLLNWSNNTGMDQAYVTNEYYGQLMLMRDDFISIVSPNIGASIFKGQEYLIEWTKYCSDSLYVILKKDGVFLDTLALLNNTVTCYNWAVPNYLAAGTGYSILVEGYYDNSISAEGYFTLYENELVIFNPATYNPESLPEGMEIVTIDGEKYLKAELSYWNNYIITDLFTVPNWVNHFGCYAKYKSSTDYQLGDINTFIQLRSTNYNVLGLIKDTAYQTFKYYESTLLQNDVVSELQLAGISTTNWDALPNDTLYVGKISAYYKKMNSQNPLNIANSVKTDHAITLDGIREAAYVQSTPNTLSRIALGEVNGEAPGKYVNNEVPDNDDNFGNWYTMWDNDNLYIFVEVTDNDPVLLPSGIATSWTCDGIEIFVDAHNRRYEGARIEGEQHQFRINYGQNSPASGGFGMPDFFGDNAETNINFSTTENEKGYNIEVAIPWLAIFRTQNNSNTDAQALISSELLAGMDMSLEISILDATDASTRKSILNWANNTGQDKAYTTSQFYGQLTLNSTEYILTLFPTASYTCYKGMETNIAWEDNLNGDVIIELLKDGELLAEIDSGITVSPFVWIPDTDLSDGVDYQIRISSTSNLSVTSVSPYFSVLTDLPKLQQPQGQLLVCSEVAANQYTTNDLSQNLDYNWILFPDNAGKMVVNENSVEISWANNFMGEAGLAVCAISELNSGEFSDTLYIKVGKSFYSAIDTAICKGDSIVFNDVTYKNTGIFSDSLVSLVGCDSVYSLKLKINSLPVVNLGDNQTIAVNESINLDAGADFVSYAWSNGEKTQTIIVNGADIEVGEHNYSVVVTDSNACKNSDAITVEVKFGDGVNENLQVVNIYPNPVSDLVTIQRDEEIVNFEIRDNAGRLVYSISDLNRMSFSINMQAYKAGLYLLKLTNSNEMVKTVRIVKE